MKRLLKKIKRKESPKPPHKPIRSEKPADIAAGPPDIRSEVDVIPEGGQNPPYEGPGVDRADLTVLQNEGESVPGSRVSSQDRVDGDQELAASTESGVAVSSGELASTGGSTSDIGRNTGPTEASTSAKETHEHTLIGGAKGNMEKFGPLKVVLGEIPALLADRTDTIVVENRVANLLWRITVLEERFNLPPSGGVPEQRRRGDLIRKLNEIKEQLRSFSEKQGLSGPVDNVQVGEDAFQLLEDLQEAILDHQMAQQTVTDGQIFRSMDSADAAILNNVRFAEQAGYRHGNRGGCLRRTRTSLLDGIELWTRDFDKPSVYWLNGLAGTGKSTIAQTIARRTSADGRLGASFFCSRDFEDRNNLRFIFPTLAVQLARRYTQFRSIFIRLVESDPEIVHESLYDQMQKLIVQPLVESTISTVIIIDALDECKDEEPASAILSVLGQFVTEIPTVKFFITGRPESRIREGFRLPLLAEATDVFVLHEVEPGQVGNDIRLFFAHSFSELKRYRRGLGDWPTGEQVDLLCERAGGLFVHAVASIRFIDHRINSPKKQLDHLLQSQESSALEGKAKFRADATIDSLYASILQEAFGGDDQENGARVRSVLGAVVLATNPLSPSSIATLLGFEPEEVYTILSLVHSLLVLKEDIDQPVRPFHKSFPDFVADPGRCVNQRFRICPPDQHTEILVGCLETMNRELERNMCNLPDGVLNSEVNDLKERIREHIGQVLEYACRSWHKHLVGTIPAHVAPVLHEFLEKKFLFWLEVLSVLGAARQAVDALEATTRCEWPDASPTLNLVRDYVRFVITFFEVINTSAPHIYHSALTLSPRTSITHKMYQKHASPLVRVVQGHIPDSWERVVATASFDYSLRDAVWSPCNKLIAVASTTVEVLDAVTLSRLSNFEDIEGTINHLCFSPDGHYLTALIDKRLVAWDLQTGCPLGTTPLFPEGDRATPLSLEHSKDGKLVAVACQSYELEHGNRYKKCNKSFIYTYDLLSGRRIGPRHVLEEQIIYPIWTHDEDLRFSTINPKSIRIWQSTFTSEQPPVELVSLPIPDEITDPPLFLFLPALSRLAFVLGNTIQVWNVKSPKLLLKSELVTYPWADFLPGSFSSDGRFFAYTSTAGEVYVWEESSAGYQLHQQLQFFTHPDHARPRLSPNGESIIAAFMDSRIHRWDTRDQVLSPTGNNSLNPFTLDFSPDEKFAAFARCTENTVTIIDLQSGEMKWNADVGVKIDCLGMARDTVIVVGENSIVTWNLPGRDRALNTGINDIVRTTINHHPSPYRYHPSSDHTLGTPHSMSISPDLSRIVVARTYNFASSLEVDDVSTGLCLARIEMRGGRKQQFTQDGRKVWAGIDGGEGEGKQCEIIEDSESGAVKLQTTDHGQRGLFRESSRGYTVTDDGWVLSPSQKRLLWLPHRWRSHMWNREWGGRFLGLLGGKLSEVVILEFFE